MILLPVTSKLLAKLNTRETFDNSRMKLWNYNKKISLPIGIFNCWNCFEQKLTNFLMKRSTMNYVQ